jgi:hypothetical protein
MKNMKTNTRLLLAAMLLLPTLAMGQMAKVDPSLTKTHMQAVGFSSNSAVGAVEGKTVHMLQGAEVEQTGGTEQSAAHI